MDENPPASDEGPSEPPAKKQEVSRIGTERQPPVGGWRDLSMGKIALAVMVLLWVAFLVWVVWEIWRM